MLVTKSTTRFETGQDLPAKKVLHFSSKETVVSGMWKWIPLPKGTEVKEDHGTPKRASDWGCFQSPSSKEKPNTMAELNSNSSRKSQKFLSYPFQNKCKRTESWRAPQSDLFQGWTMFLDCHKWGAGEPVNFHVIWRKVLYQVCFLSFIKQRILAIIWKSELCIFTQWKLMPWWEQISLYP